MTCLIAAYVLGLVGGFCVRDWSKLARWAERIEEKRKENENS